MSNYKRRVYRVNDLERFIERATEYIIEARGKRTMTGLCHYLGITRHTLSKYKYRNELWFEAIEDIKLSIASYNIIFCDPLVEHLKPF